MKLNVVVLAAGKGTRMMSNKPKVLHHLAGKPLLSHVLDTAHQLDCSSLWVVTGYGAEQVESELSDQATGFVLQAEQRGTGHAVQQAAENLESGTIALVLYADVPLIRAATLKRLLAQVNENTMAVLTCEVDQPAGLGRIIRDSNGQIASIVEEKDASTEEKAIREINTGIMAFPVNRLLQWLPELRANNAQKEYYLTDVIELALNDGCEVVTSLCDDQGEITGINDRIQLAQLERKYQQAMHEDIMKNGVSLADPSRFDIRGEVTFGKDVIIDVNVILEGNVSIADNVTIGAGCILKNCSIGQGTQLHPYTVIEDALIGQDCQLGPFARVRPGTELADEAKLGNFVEVKKAVIGKGSKVNHLTYIGDAELGEGVNVGAGTITCNYDGVNKHKTLIGNNVFIGSNAVLVAPIELADGAFVAAGSTLTKNVPEDELAVGRARQTNIAGWKRAAKKSGKQ